MIQKEILKELKSKLPKGYKDDILKVLKRKKMRTYSKVYISKVLNPELDDYNEHILKAAIEVARKHKKKQERLKQAAKSV
jgi:hypothetical protein